MLDIRPATAPDAPAAAEVFLAARAGMTYLPVVHTDDETRGFVASLVDAGRVLVATDGAEVVGLAWWARRDDDGWLDGLYVSPTTQGRSVGGALFEAVTRQLPEGFHLWVFQDNTGARRFYERRGAVLVRETDGRDNEERMPDALLRWQPGARPVLLRAVLESDLETLYEQQADPQAWQMAAIEPKDREAHAAHRRRIAATPTAVARAVVADGRLVGNIGSWQDGDEVQLGYLIGREYWGRGLATDALQQYLEEVHARPMTAYVVESNRASRRVLEKCGFAFVEAEEPSGDPPVIELRYVLER